MLPVMFAGRFLEILHLSLPGSGLPYAVITASLVLAAGMIALGRFNKARLARRKRADAPDANEKVAAGKENAGLGTAGKDEVQQVPPLTTYQQVVENSPNPIFVIDPNGRVCLWNQCARAFFQREDELLGSSYESLLPDQMDREHVVALVGRVLRERASFDQIEICFQLRNCTARWLLTNLYPIELGRGETGCVFAGIDIHERKLIEAKEHEQRLLAEALVDTAAALSSTIDLEEVLDRILKNLSFVAPHDGAFILMVENGVARIARYQFGQITPPAEMITSLRLPVELTATLREASQTGHPLVLSNVKEYPGWVQIEGMLWVRSYASIPIQIKGALIGFLNMVSATPNFFKPEQAECLVAFANQAGIALENARLVRVARQNAHRNALLNEITQAAVRAPDLNSLLQMLANRLGELFDSPGVCITMWDEERQADRLVAAFGTMGDPSPKLKGRFHNCPLTASVLAAGQVLPVENVICSEENDLHSLDTDPGNAASDTALLGLPLIADGCKLGAAFISFRAGHQFTPDEIALGEQTAAQLALSISKTQLVITGQERAAKLDRSNQIMMALSRIALNVAQFYDLNRIMDSIGAELATLEVNCVIALIDSGGSDLGIRYTSFDPERLKNLGPVEVALLSHIRITPDHFQLYDQIMVEQRPVVTDDIVSIMKYSLPDMPAEKVDLLIELLNLTPPTRHVLLPLIAEKQTIGLLWLWGDLLDGSDLPVAAIFASQVAVALENARLYAQTQQLAMTDELTGAYNRRGLNELGCREFERASRFGHPLAALIIDIDHFKLVNDQYGHQTGDLVLQGFAQRCRNSVREIDIFCRYGGEEFVILLPETDLSTACKVGERLRRSIAGHPITGEDFEVFLSVSVGVSGVTPKTQDLDQLISDADQALYLAKQAGRNRVGAKFGDSISVNSPS